MIGFAKRRYGPIGVDFGTRSVKLMQFNADQTKLLDAVRWEIDRQGETPEAPSDAQFAEALGRARQGRKFRGSDVVFCLGAAQMFVQNVRLPKALPEEWEKLVRQEASARLPFPLPEAEIRFFSGTDVRQGDSVKREVVLLACHRPVLERALAIVHDAGLRPVAVDVEPAAVLRCFLKQLRREDDLNQRVMFVHIGASNAMVMVAKGAEILFVKYVDVGGCQMDDAVAKNLNMSLEDASALRRHNGDRRTDQQDPEVARSIGESTRPVLDRLAGELSLCLRYQSVTFRGQSVARVVFGGGEATPGLVEAISTGMELKCELADPLRSFPAASLSGRRGQWDVAAGLALRDVN